MNNFRVYTFFLVAFTYAAAQADGANTYKTSVGAVFTQVQGPGNFGKAWQDPNETIWSAYQGDHRNNAIKPDQNNVVVGSPATEACAKIGGKLPIAQQYKKFATYFETDSNGYFTNQGRKDLFTIFPGMNGRGFWTSSVYPFDKSVAYVFGADSGIVGTIDGERINYFISVRCTDR